MSEAIATPIPEYLDLTTAAKALPGRPHAATLWRWARKGVKVRGAEDRIRLQHVRAGARLLTTQAWLDRFMAELAEADRGYFDAPAPVPAVAEPVRGQRTPEQRAAAVAAARARIAGSR